MVVSKTDYGIEITTENHFVFFGNRATDKNKIEARFSDFDFFYLKQVHGNHVVDCQNGEPVADAHIAHQLQQAPVVATADCMPIVILTGSQVAVIHAGWRGVENEIILESAKKLKLDEKTLAFIGPHIQFTQFEVGSDVADRLTASYARVCPLQTPSVVRPHASQDKSYIHLAQIARAQLFHCQIQNVWVCDIDTLTQSEFASFRRDGKSAGRQYSFAVRLS